MAPRSMKKRTHQGNTGAGRVLVALLAVALLLTTLSGVVFSAVETEAEPPAITVTGEVDTWDGSAVETPVNRDTDGAYLIEKAAHFVWLLNNATVGTTDTYRLTKNLDMGGIVIKSSEVNRRAFGGVLDGAGYAISRLTVEGQNNHSPAVLFNTMTGTIKNLTLNEYTATATAANKSKGGCALVARLNGGTLENVRAHVSMKNLDVGGLVTSAENGARITGCIVSGSITSTTGGVSGGIAAYISGATVSGCASYVDLVGEGTNSLGGIVGYANVATSTFEIINCTSYGTVTCRAGAANIGGILGNSYRQTMGVLRDCTNYGAVASLEETSGKVRAGGIVGYMGDARAIDLTADYLVNYGDVTAPLGVGVGGIIGSWGQKAGATFTSCANYGDISGASNVGGLLGDGNAVPSASKASFGIPQFQNSGSYGSVTASVGYAGGIAGIYDILTKGTLVLNNVVVTATVTAPTCAGALFGSFFKSSGSHAGVVTPVEMTGVLVDATVRVTAEGGTAGVFAAETRITTKEPPFQFTYTGCGFAVTCYAPDGAGGETSVSPYTYYDLNGVGAVDAAMPTLNVIKLANGTYLAALNALSEENGYKTWMIGTEGMPVFYTPPAELLGTVLLNRTYDGTPSTVSWRVNSDAVKEVEVLWYSLGEGDTATLLEEAPTDAGRYRVTLVPKDESGLEIVANPAAVQDFEITKATATVVGHQGAYSLTGNAYTTTYNGEELIFTSEVRGVAGKTLVGETPVLTVSGTATVAKEPGDYTLTFAWAGNRNYNAASAEYTLTVNKISVAYPTNTWTLPQNGSIRYAGESATVSLVHDSAIYAVTYGGDRTAATVTPAGEFLVATAEVALADPDHYAFVGDAPEYRLTWRQDKGRVWLRMLDGEGEEVALDRLTYTGNPLVYYVYAYNEAGNRVTGTALGIVEVLNAGTYAPSFTYPGTDFYETASLSVEYTVLPVTVTPTHPTSLSKYYDGTPVVPAPVLGDAPSGTSWAPVTYLWEKLTEGEWQELPTAPAGGGTYRMTAYVTTADGAYAVSGQGNYCGSVTSYFTISRAVPTLSFDFAGTLYVLDGQTYVTTYNGELQPVFFETTSDGAVTLLYNASTSAPVDAGTYTVTLSVAQTDNYEALSTPEITLTVRKLQINLDEAEWTYTAPYVYDGTQKEVTLTPAFLAAYGEYVHSDILYVNHTSTNAGAPVAEALLKLKNTVNLTFARGGEEVAGESAKVTLAWEIQKATVDLSAIYFSDAGQDKVYNGMPQNLTLVGADGAHLSYVMTPGRVGAGTYEVVATLTLEDTVNYNPLASTTVEAQMTIAPVSVSFSVEEDTDRVTYNNQPHAFTPLLTDGAGNRYTSFSVTVKNAAGEVVSPDEVVGAGTYTFVYELTDNVNFVGSSLTKTLTVDPAVYDANNYVPVSKIVLYDGQAHTLSILLGAGLDGEAITVVNTPASFTEPGVYTVTFELAGSANYQPIPPVSATLTILALSATEENGAVTLTPPDGFYPDWTLSGEETDGDTASDALLAALEEHADTSGKDLKALYLLSVTDGEGASVKCGAVTVTILVDEKYRQNEGLTFVVVETDKNGKTVVKTMDKVKSLNHTYDPETGILTFTTNDLSASYGYVAKDSPLPVILGIAGGAVVLVGVTVLAVLLIKRRKGTSPDGGGEDILDAPLYEEEPLAWDTPDADAPWEDAPADDPTEGDPTDTE